ncbi:MAG: hypothetical protein Q4D26_05735 [Clostridia bacterium]|nr:hypothetical protein [Clostridia bacterium]
MEETIIVIMLKDKNTGFLEKEIASLDITENVEYIVNIFAVDEEEGRKLHIKLSTERNVEDWEYSAIYDYYDTECFAGRAEVIDADDDYNPVWEVVIDYKEDIAVLEDNVAELLAIHRKEIEDVFETIKDKESEYTDGE